MKIAVLIVGEYRTFAACRKTMAFLDQDNIDVYVSTWDKTNIKNPQRIGSQGYDEYKPVYQDVTKDQVQKDIGMPCSIEIQDSSIIENEAIDWKKMILSWLLGFKKIKESSVKYDYVMILRPDLFFESNTLIDLTKFKNAKNSIGAIVTTDGTSINDAIFFGTVDNMDKVIDPSLVTDAKYLNHSYGTIHNILLNHIKNTHNLEIVPLPITGEAIIARYPTSMTEKFQTVHARFYKWFKDGKYDF